MWFERSGLLDLHLSQGFLNACGIFVLEHLLVGVRVEQCCNKSGPEEIIELTLQKRIVRAFKAKVFQGDKSNDKNCHAV